MVGQYDLPRNQPDVQSPAGDLLLLRGIAEIKVDVNGSATGLGVDCISCSNDAIATCVFRFLIWFLQFGSQLTPQESMPTMILSIDQIILLLFSYKYHIIITSIALYIIKGYYIAFHKLRAFKGPWATNLTELWYARAAFGTEQHLVLANTCKKYGTFSLSLPQTLISTTSQAKSPA